MNTQQQLEELIQYSHEISIRLIKQEKLDFTNIEHIVAASMFRELLSQLDGLAILTKYQAGAAATVVYRTVYEIYLSFLYLFELVEKRAERALAYAYSHLILQKNVLDLYGHRLVGEEAAIEKAIEQLTVELNGSKYERIAIEWGRTKKKLTNNRFEPKWYSLFDGPISFVKLIEFVEEPEKRFLYEQISLRTHGLKSMDMFSKSGEYVKVYALRYKDTEDEEKSSIKLLVTVLLLLVNNFAFDDRPEVLKFLLDIKVIEESLFQ